MDSAREQSDTVSPVCRRSDAVSGQSSSSTHVTGTVAWNASSTYGVLSDSSM